MTAPATIIVGQPVRPGCEDEYVRWQQELTTEASRYPGYLSSELTPPSEHQTDWTALYKFDSLANAQQWLDSSSRQNMLERAAGIFVGPGSRQIITADNEVSDALVTVLITHRVPEDRVDEFLAWCAEMTEAERRFPGFRGSETFRPVDGATDEWNICIKFDTTEHMNAWLTSDERTAALRSAPLADFSLRRIDHSFGNWLPLSDHAARPPSGFKSALAVWMGLYPTITILTLLLRPLHMPLWCGLLVGNLTSSFVMSYFTMPYYSNPILKWWLRPKPDARQPHTDLVGFGKVLLINAVWAAFFIVLTTRVLHLS